MGWRSSWTPEELACALLAFAFGVLIWELMQEERRKAEAIARPWRAEAAAAALLEEAAAVVRRRGERAGTGELRGGLK